MARSTSPFPGTSPQTRALELFQPPLHAVYHIDVATRLADLPRRTVLVCCKYGLVMPIADSAGYHFNGSAIHVLRRVAALRDVCGDDFAGMKIILDLLNRLEQMHSEVQMLRVQQPGKPKSQRKRKTNRRYDYGYI